MTRPQLDGLRMAALADWIETTEAWLIGTVETSRATSRRSAAVERVTFDTAELDDLLAGVRLAAAHMRAMAPASPSGHRGHPAYLRVVK